MEKNWQILSDSKVIHQGTENEMITAFEFMTNEIEVLKENYPDQEENNLIKQRNEWSTPLKGEILLVQIHDKKYLI